MKLNCPAINPGPLCKRKNIHLFCSRDHIQFTDVDNSIVNWKANSLLLHKIVFTSEVKFIEQDVFNNSPVTMIPQALNCKGNIVYYIAIYNSTEVRRANALSGVD